MNLIGEGSRLERNLEKIGGWGLLCRSFFAELLQGHFELKLLAEQIYFLGSRSFPLIAVTALSTGMVMSLQFGITLAKFGGQPYVPRVVSLSFLRELGPVFTSLMVAARVGAGIASEIGSMMVTQQVDAIRALGTSPIRKIVVPRVLACVICLPLLATLANIIGILGAFIISLTEFNLDAGFFFQKIFYTLVLPDYFSGVGKTVFFGFFIGISSCYFGLNVKEGTREVGDATTKAVVASSIMVLIGDYFLTKIFFLL
jgi:phospholipid/cholesterol/gamma-HCH transport system permease protein